MEIIEKGHYLPGAEGLLAPLKPFFEDSLVTEILINRPGEVFVEKNGVMKASHLPMLDASHLRRLFTLIANENGQCLTRETPILSGNLYDGSRVQLVIPPASRNYTLSIRRPSLKKFTLSDYRASNFYKRAKAYDPTIPFEEALSEDEKQLRRFFKEASWADFVDLAVHMKKNMVISGETSSGKTTYLNACTAYIPEHERIITLEDTYEIDIPHQNVVRLCATGQGDGVTKGVSMQDLVKCSLRLRPDRIIMGEIRNKEVMDFVSASSTGHEGTITSIHARNPRGAFMRMMQLYKLNNVPSMNDADIFRELNEVIDIVLQVAIDDERYLSSVYLKGVSPLGIF